MYYTTIYAYTLYTILKFAQKIKPYKAFKDFGCQRTESSGIGNRSALQSADRCNTDGEVTCDDEPDTYPVALRDKMSRYSKVMRFAPHHHNVRVVIKGKNLYVDGTLSTGAFYMTTDARPVYYEFYYSGRVLIDYVPGHKPHFMYSRIDK